MMCNLTWTQICFVSVGWLGRTWCIHSRSGTCHHQQVVDKRYFQLEPRLILISCPVCFKLLLAPSKYCTVGFISGWLKSWSILIYHILNNPGKCFWTTTGTREWRNWQRAIPLHTNTTGCKIHLALTQMKFMVYCRYCSTLVFVPPKEVLELYTQVIWLFYFWSSTDDHHSMIHR